MFRIAKNLVRTLEESVTGTVGDKPIDSYFHSVPPQLFPIREDDPRYAHQTDSLYGLRVVQVDESQLQLTSFFDYIIGFNNQPIPLVQDGTMGASQTFYPDYKRIISFFNEHCGNTIKLHVWSGKGGVYREEYLYVSAKNSVSEIPLDETDAQQSLMTSKMFEALGFKVQWTPLIAVTYSYHVLQLNIENGPAMQAGLIPDQDYIIACQDGLLATGGEHLLQDIVRSRANHSLVLYVYNKAVDCVRPVTVHLAADGRLGCNVGYGFLHRIPAPIQNSQSIIHSPAAVESHNSNNIIHPITQPILIPATLANNADNKETMPSNPLQVPVPVGRRQAQLHRGSNTTNAAAASASMADYFQEGKDQSPRSSSKATPPPPPPASSTASNTASD